LDLFLIGTAAGWSILGILKMILVILEVAVALGLVIFVHELGHFAVAKLCGVKVERFYLGFNIYGISLLKFTRGETEYGIGILPLGGYVKMLGQEDNPARLREEIERAKLRGATAGAASSAADGGTASGSNSSEPAGPASAPISADVAAAEQALYDPRSYLAKSVPQRMAIISAGVIMNLIFAFVVAVLAYWIGVEQTVCGVGDVVPGEAAWRADLRVGDRIVEIAGKPVHRFQDLKTGISLGDIDAGVPMVIERPGRKEPVRTVVYPDRFRPIPTIGILSPRTTSLLDTKAAIQPGSAASQAQPELEPGDRIVQIDDQRIQNHAELHRYLAQHPGKTLGVTVERQRVEAEQQAAENQQPLRITVQVPAQPVRRLGLVLEMGSISAVQDNSPAAAAGLRPGDLIQRIDGSPAGDPMTLPERLGGRAGETVTVSIQREGHEGLVEVRVTLRQTDRFNPPMDRDNALSLPALGVAYHVLNRVQETVQESPARQAGVQEGDVIVRARLIAPRGEQVRSAVKQRDLSLEFGEQQRNWPLLVHALQETLPGTCVELTWTRDGTQQWAVLEPMMAKDWFYPDRGMVLGVLEFRQQAQSVSEAVQLGAEETADATMMVYRFLHKLGGQVSPTALGGPIAIFQVAQHAAHQGLSQLLIFLTLLSANLAVLNFLPIPVLDGGHMVLLAWEGIRGKPASERVQTVLTMAGLIFILGLMLWVMGLDIYRLVAR